MIITELQYSNTVLISMLEIWCFLLPWWYDEKPFYLSFSGRILWLCRHGRDLLAVNNPTQTAATRQTEICNNKVAPTYTRSRKASWRSKMAGPVCFGFIKKGFGGLDITRPTQIHSILWVWVSWWQDAPLNYEVAGQNTMGTWHSRDIGVFLLDLKPGPRVL